MGNVQRTLGLDTPRSRASFDCFLDKEQCDASELTSSSNTSHSCKTSRAVSTKFSSSSAYSQQSVLELLLSEVRQLRIDVDGIKEILRNQESSGTPAAVYDIAQKSAAAATDIAQKVEHPFVKQQGDFECTPEIEECVEVVEGTTSDTSRPTSLYSVAVESI